MARRHEEQMHPGPRPIVTLLILLGCIIVLGMIFAAIKVFVVDRALAIPQENGTIEVYFCPQDNCEDRLLGAISNASSLSCAFYELNLPRTRQVLAQEQAVVLIDDENAPEIKDVRVQSTPSRGLMHDKFCIINASVVVTGSMNPTTNDATLNNNNLLIIRSPAFVQRYEQEFAELAARRDESYQKNRARPLKVNISGHLVEQRFCPQESCEAAVVQAISDAEHEVAFMTFSFTSDPIGDAMMQAGRRGAAVHGVFERRQIDQWSEYERLRDAGLDVRIDGNRRTMHHKVIIIDNSTVITGSYNPSANANERNDENLIIIHDPAIAAKYMQEFARVQEAALDFEDQQ